MKLQVENLGHSTFRVKFDCLEILTDPFLTESAGGIKRVVPPPLKPEELSPDIVLISHAHYDHLDLKTLKRLKGDFTTLTPLGCKEIIKKGKIIELKDFETVSIKGAKITKIPVIHNKGRSPLHMKTEVGGYIVEFKGVKLLFAGDTAFSEKLYSLWKEKGGEIKFAFLPIGGFMPFFRKFHQTPEEALKGFKILGAETLIPIHFGTWHLIPYYAKGERALERLLAYSYICSLREKVKELLPGEKRSFDIET